LTTNNAIECYLNIKDKEKTEFICQFIAKAACAACVPDLIIAIRIPPAIKAPIIASNFLIFIHSFSSNEPMRVLSLEPKTLTFLYLEACIHT
jgi:hypothetical protein